MIKPHNRVSEGHPIKEWRQSANANEAIARRALKCVENGNKIVFEYDHNVNGETFANLILFDCDESTQAPDTNPIIKRKDNLLDTV